MSETLKTTVYKDIKIHVVWDRASVVFKVDHHDWKDRWDRFTSLEAAHDAIDKYLQAKARVLTNKADISRKMIDENGTPLTVIGIRRSDGYMKVRDYRPVNQWGHVRNEEVKEFSGDAYPDRPWIREILHERKQLREKLRELEKKLGKTEVRLRVGYGRKIDIQDYERHIRSIEEQIDKAEAEANRIEKTMKETA